MPLFSRRPVAAEPPELPYDPLSPEGLAARWVRWAAAFPGERGPIADSTGEFASGNQPPDVWFLAGSYGDRVSRRCGVPAGRPLFLPVFNMWQWPARGPQEPVADAYGSLEVDGVAVPPDLITTPTPFGVAGAPGNGVTGKTKIVPTTVWGLWKHLPPLAAGRHEVHMVGGDGHGFVVDVTYLLDVASGCSTSPAGEG